MHGQFSIQKIFCPVFTILKENYAAIKFQRINGQWLKQLSRAHFDPTRLSKRLTDFDTPEDYTHAKYDFYPTTWVVQENTQFVTVRFFFVVGLFLSVFCLFDSRTRHTDGSIFTCFRKRMCLLKKKTKLECQLFAKTKTSAVKNN